MFLFLFLFLFLFFDANVLALFDSDDFSSHLVSSQATKCSGRGKRNKISDRWRFLSSDQVLME